MLPHHAPRPAVTRPPGHEPAVTREFGANTRVAPIGVPVMGNWCTTTLLHGTCA